MKRLCLIVVYIVFIQSIYGQTDSLGNWIVNITAGIEAHDKRLFNYSEKKSLLELQPEFWGTYDFGASLKRKFWENTRVTSFIGLGITYKDATFLRPFDHSYFEKDSFRILRNLDRYKKVELPISLAAFYEFSNSWFISCLISSNALLHRRIDHTENHSGVFPYTESTFEFNDINLRLGMNCRIDNWLIGVNSRLVNFQRIDKIIFNDIIKDPRSDQSWEWSNPLRFELSVGYMW